MPSLCVQEQMLFMEKQLLNLLHFEFYTIENERQSTVDHSLITRCLALIVELQNGENNKLFFMTLNLIWLKSLTISSLFFFSIYCFVTY